MILHQKLFRSPYTKAANNTDSTMDATKTITITVAKILCFFELRKFIFLTSISLERILTNDISIFYYFSFISCLVHL